MREEIANLVCPVLTYGLEVRERLTKGEELNIDEVQARLRDLLQTEVAARQYLEFGGEMASTTSVSMRDLNRDAGAFLGLRYALSSWVDEIMISESPWAQVWNERKLETALYGLLDRAWKFWEQAAQTESYPNSDALEGFFLCVVLGFRGDYRDNNERLGSWVSAVQGRLAKSAGGEFQLPAELEAPASAPPLRGRQAWLNMMTALGAITLLIIPIVAFIVVQQLGQ